MEIAHRLDELLDDELELDDDELELLDDELELDDDELELDDELDELLDDELDELLDDELELDDDELDELLDDELELDNDELELLDEGALLDELPNEELELLLVPTEGLAEPADVPPVAADVTGSGATGEPVHPTSPPVVASMAAPLSSSRNSRRALLPVSSNADPAFVVSSIEASSLASTSRRRLVCRHRHAVA